MKLLEWGCFEPQQDTSLHENISYLLDRQIFCVQAVPASHFGPFANLFQADRPTDRPALAAAREGGRERERTGERKKERNERSGGKESLLHISAPPFPPSPPLPQQQRVVVLRGKPGLGGFALRFR